MPAAGSTGPHACEHSRVCANSGSGRARGWAHQTRVSGALGHICMDVPECPCVGGEGGGRGSCPNFSHPFAVAGVPGDLQPKVQVPGALFACGDKGAWLPPTTQSVTPPAWGPLVVGAVGLGYFLTCRWGWIQELELYPRCHPEGSRGAPPCDGGWGSRGRRYQGVPRGLGAGGWGWLSISNPRHLPPSPAPALAPDDATENEPSQVTVLPAPRVAPGRALLSAPQGL